MPRKRKYPVGSLGAALTEAVMAAKKTWSEDKAAAFVKRRMVEILKAQRREPANHAEPQT